MTEQEKIELAEFHYQSTVKSTISLIKAEAARRINTIAPLYKQVNLYRENPSDPIFAQIDAIRVRSNELEEMIKTYTQEQLDSFNARSAW